MLVPIFYACNNDDDNGTPAGPTITAPDNASVATGASLDLTFAVTVPGGYASATPSVEPAAGSTVTVTQQPADGATGGNVVVSFTGGAEGEVTVTLAVVDQLNQPAEATVRVTVTPEGTTPPPATLLSAGDTIAKLPELSSLLQALTDAELIDALNQGEKITIFAPNNTAFADLLTDQGVADLPALLAQLSKAGLSNVLQAHVVADSLPADLLESKEYPTLNANATVNVVKMGDNVTVNGAAVVTPNIFTSNGVIHIIDSVINRPPPPVAEGVFTVVDTIASRDELSRLEAALQAVNIIETLRTEGPFTVFAPNNAAFDALIAAQEVSDLNGLVTKLGADAVASILQAHVVPQTITAADIVDKDVYNTVGGATLTATVDVNTGAVRINGTDVLETDLIAENGVVHLIDSVVNLSASSDGSGGFTVTIENVSTEPRFYQHGVFSTPVGATAAGPATPGMNATNGGVYEFTFNAGPVLTTGQRTRLSFVTMLAASNDLFIAPGQDGIELYNANNVPITGNISDQVFLWDAGTKNNDTDADDNAPVALYSGTAYPAAASLVDVTISNVGTLFTVRIANKTGDPAVPNSDLSPGVWGVHTVTAPIFGTDRGAGSDGLKLLAEDGDPTELAATFDRNEGFAVPLSPGVFAVHGSQVRPVLVTGEVDRGVGLEALAEDGDPTTLATTLSQNADLKASGTFGAAPAIGPGGSYSFTIDAAEPGDHLTIVTMNGQSNDIIYSTPENGIPLYRTNGRPFNGNASRLMVAYDIGTEANEYPGAGLNQLPRQAAPNTGPTDPNNRVRFMVTNDISPADDGFIYRPVGERIRVTITPN
jgi:uncharacterized surface protein with fasciclin (FAS1) repeats